MYLNANATTLSLKCPNANTSKIAFKSGMPTGSHKKRGTTFCGKLDGELPLPVRSFKDPPYIARNYLLGFRRISAVNIW